MSPIYGKYSEVSESISQIKCKSPRGERYQLSGKTGEVVKYSGWFIGASDCCVDCSLVTGALVVVGSLVSQGCIF